MATFTDTHAHLHFDDFKNDIDNVIENSINNGVSRIITVGINVADSKKAINLASKYENIYATVGIHPQDCKNFNEKDYLELKELATNKKVIAIGEIGLDYYRMYVEKEKQQDTFKKMLFLANELKKPVIIHNRDANEDCINIMDSIVGKGKGYGGIFHCFSGGQDVIDWALDNDFYISYAGQVTYKSAEDLRKSLKKIDLNKILVETDCPYLSPVPMRGKRNESANVLHTASFIAKELNISVEEFSSYTENNFNTLFNGLV